MKSNEIRKRFLDFFKSKGHAIVPSAPMVVKNDPSLMFINAGMNPFKDFFLGNSTPNSHRIADTQKCLRVSGKHNDLEEVGIDTYHHTMFEMLGNWSFGDYFKKEAIAWAWELLTKVYKIPKEDLYVTVFEGSKDSDNLPIDRQAYDFWKEIVPESQIIMGNKEDNFWEMGDQGPCGPCSEIHVDIRPQSEKNTLSGASLVNKNHPLVIELWNLVFMQYSRKADGSLEELPKKHIDTGMGFERLSMVLQGVKSSYDTDIFTPIIREIEIITNTQYGVDEKTDIAIRVIADHLRAVSFSIADGQLPSNVAAGYVIRRILRRAVRYGFTFLNKKEPFIYRLVKVLSSRIGIAFPEIEAQKQLIENVIKEEEHSFLNTLEQGLVLLSVIIDQTNGKLIDGAKAFELYDTYGFPLDLTQLIASEKGYEVDTTAFDAKMKAQKNRSRNASQIASDDWVIVSEDDQQEFVGYDTLNVQVRLVKYRKITTAKQGEQYQLVFNLTPFYAAGGGQVGDKGYIESANGDVVYILDTKKENNTTVHFVKNLPKNLKNTFKAIVDGRQRQQTACNHTATHLLHQALREVLGSHVTQKGSAVHSKYLRFDFSHFSKLTPEELSDVEEFVNARIEGKLPLEEHRKLPMQEALNKGAIALFGEKYGDNVRIIQFGQSIELCGGTHVKNTSELWSFKITSESAVAAGVRRIEAITFDTVKDYYFNTHKEFNQIKELLNKPQHPVKAVKTLQEENTELKKQLEKLLLEKTKDQKLQIEQELLTINGLRFLAKETTLDQNTVKNIAFELGNKYPNLFLVFASTTDNKVLLSCYISKPLVSERGYDAAKLIKTLGKLIQGGGGGQAFFATAGGKNIKAIPEVLEQSKAYIASP